MASMGNILPDDNGIFENNVFQGIGNGLKNIGNFLWENNWVVKGIKGIKDLITDYKNDPEFVKEKINEGIDKTIHGDYKNEELAYDWNEITKNNILNKLNPYKDETNETQALQDTSDTKELETETQIIEKIEDEQQKLWNREDEIRKHVEEREDTAYQRAVADMIAAGINPAVFGVSPAQSGGGITSATSKDYSILTTYMNNLTNEVLAGKNNGTKLLSALSVAIPALIKLALTYL